MTSGTRSTDVADQLRLMILSGALDPGSPLRLEALRLQTGFSLSPIREALLKLSAEGCVTSEDQRGFRVAPVSQQNLEEVTWLRRLLEPAALRVAIDKGGDDWEDRLVTAFHRLERSERRGRSDMEEWEKAHRAFHGSLIGACGMPLAMQMCRVLHNLSDRYRRLFLSSNPHDRNVPSEHRAILDATLAREADRAARLLEDHVGRTGTAVARYLRDHTAKGAALQATEAVADELEDSGLIASRPPASHRG